MAFVEFLTLLLLLEVAKSQEVTTPSNLLGPRNFNHHVYEAKLKSLMGPVPTRKGPVLFPNDVPSAQDTPIIASPRLLTGTLLNQLNANRHLNDSANVQTFLAPITKYSPMVYGTLPPNSDDGILSPTVGTNVIDEYGYDSAPYTDIVKKSITGFDFDNNYQEYEQPTSLPPIYKALSQHEERDLFNTQRKAPLHDYQQSTSLPPIYNALSQHAERNLLDAQRKSPAYDYQSKSHIQQYTNKDSSNDEHNSENIEDKSYAFSYAVKDQKTGDDFSHSQRSSGSATNGEYRVRLPDGRMQIVSYTADENGYKADVRYDVDGASIEYSDSRVDAIAGQKPNYNPSQNKISHGYSPSQKTISQDYNPSLTLHYSNKDYSNAPSREIYDYSVENENIRTPYRSKFASLYSAGNEFSGLDFSTTPRPSYDLADILANAAPNVRPTLYTYTGTATSNTGGATSSDLPNIRPNFYDNYSATERGGRSATSDPLSDNPLNSFVASTPRSYLVSTIASLRDRASAKPVLSDSFISRINKYLSFK